MHMCSACGYRCRQALDPLLTKRLLCVCCVRELSSHVGYANGSSEMVWKGICLYPCVVVKTTFTVGWMTRIPPDIVCAALGEWFKVWAVLEQNPCAVSLKALLELVMHEEVVSMGAQSTFSVGTSGALLVSDGGRADSVLRDRQHGERLH